MVIYKVYLLEMHNPETKKNKGIWKEYIIFLSLGTAPTQ